MTETSVTTWLASREGAPDSLAALVHRLTSAQRGDSSAADVLLTASEKSLRSLLPNGCMKRSDALELLAADALVTYAFEAAAEDPATLEECATTAMCALSAVAENA